MSSSLIIPETIIPGTQYLSFRLKFQLLLYRAAIKDSRSTFVEVNHVA